jgi:monoamine oxidase
VAGSPETLDAIIIGAGLAGLAAARKLVESRRDVLVLEARDRVGGRTLTHRLEGQAVDLGGQWIAPAQERISALVRELGLATCRPFSDGEKLLERRSRLRRYRGNLPHLPPVSRLELRFTLSRLDKLRARVPLTHPAAAGQAPEWDGVTVESFKRTLKTRPVRALVDASLGALWGAAPSEMSLLGLLFHLNSSGGLLKPMRGGNGELRLVEGAQEIAARIAQKLGDRVRLSSPVRAVEQDGGAVIAHFDGGSCRARRCIVALPPLLAGRIRYTPPLPTARDQLTQRMPMGHVINVLGVYAGAFWRARGLTGEVVSDRPPLRICIDATRGAGPFVLCGVAAGDDARELGRLSPADRKNRALDAFARWFGEEARRPIAFVEKDWADDPWSGGSVGLLPPGTLTRYGAALREPVGRIHWAGSETSPVWCGHMEGALASGERAASEVLKGNHT